MPGDLYRLAALIDFASRSAKASTILPFPRSSFHATHAGSINLPNQVAEQVLLMSTKAPMEPDSGHMAEHFDVLIIGAGISGIDAAYHLNQACPDKRYVLLETQHGFGGTWRTHTYPGIRSDSDLYTFGYKWKPWTGAPIATAEQILTYLDEALDEQDIRRHIRYGHRVVEAAWDGSTKRWVLRVEQSGRNEAVTMSCTFLWMCQGYYRHSEGYTPEFSGRERFEGRIVHPQTWPEDLDYQGKRVVVIGSGATAATLIPAIADECAHVTMLQRSPTYYYAKPNVSELAELLRPLDLPDKWFHEIVRRRYLHDQKEITRRSFEEPEGLRAELLEGCTSLSRAGLSDGSAFHPELPSVAAEAGRPARR